MRKKNPLISSHAFKKETEVVEVTNKLDKSETMEGLFILHKKTMYFH